MIADASVLRNFGVLGWGDHLIEVAGGAILAAHGVVGLDGDEPGELERVRDALTRIAHQHLGTGMGSRALAAVRGIDDLLSRRPDVLRVVTLTGDERMLAIRLQSRDPEDRAWRRDELGARARRLDLGEAVSIAVAVNRGLDFACDEDDGGRVYAALASRDPLRTLDLVKAAMDRSLLKPDEARGGYEELLDSDLHRFGGPPWESG